MTDTQKSKREEFEAWYHNNYAGAFSIFGNHGAYLTEHAQVRWLGWQAATAQSAEKIARLEAENKELRDLYYELAGIAADVDAGKGFDIVCRKTLRRVMEALAQPISTEALDAYVAKLTKWQPIETAPKDGTEIIVWFRPHGAKSVKWTDSEGNSDSKCAHWHVDDHKHGPFPVRGYGAEDATHWMPLPPAPEKE